MAPLEQARQAAELAREAFAVGDKVSGIAAIVLAAQLIQIVRLQQQWAEPEAAD